MTDYKVVYVSGSDSPSWSIIRDMPDNVTWCRDSWAKKNCVDEKHANTVWIVRGNTEVASYIYAHGVGRTSTFSSKNPAEWMNEVAQNPEGCSVKCAGIDLLPPPVPAVGLAATEAGRRDFAIGGKVDPEKVQESINRAIAGGGLKFHEEPKAEPRTTLVTQVEVLDAVDPIGDTLHYAKEAAGVDRDAFPEDGLVSIQWTKVHGRNNLRKFTITVDFKESN